MTRNPILAAKDETIQSWLPAPMGLEWFYEDFLG